MTLRCHNRVLLLLALIALAAAFLPFVNYAPNRLVSGESRQIWQVWSFPAAGLLALLLVPIALSMVPGRAALAATLVLSQLLFIALAWSCGEAATRLAAAGSPLARTSPGSGLWLWLLLALLAFSDAARRLNVGPLWRWLLNVQIWIVPLFLLWRGAFGDLSLMKEYANRQEVFDGALQQHLILLFGTLLPGLAIGVPIGLWCWRHAARQGRVFTVLNVIQTVPSVALFGLLIAPLAGLVKTFPWLGTLGVSGTGLAPALIALVLYALLPLVRGVVAGLQQVPAEVLELSLIHISEPTRRLMASRMPSSA